MKKIFTALFTLFILFAFPLTVKANEIKLVDDADVLNINEETELQLMIANYIETTGYDMVICFMNDDSTEYNIEGYADDYLNYNGYGLGSELSGIILYVSVNGRLLCITTSGECIDTYTDAAIYDLYDATASSMSSDWYSGAVSFIEKAGYIASHYDYYHQTYSEPAVISTYTPTKADIAKEAMIPALMCGLVAALIVFIVLAKQLKTEGIKTNAGQYTKDVDIDLFRSGEVYLYTSRSVRRIEQPKPSNNGGGMSSHSSTHHSSSGRTHGGGGSRRF